MDELIDPASVDEAQSRNESGQWLLYENAGHGFLDVEDPNYDQSSADDAWARILAATGLADMPSGRIACLSVRLS